MATFGSKIFRIGKNFTRFKHTYICHRCKLEQFQSYEKIEDSSIYTLK